MKANLELDEHQMRIAAEEEKKRRREFTLPYHTLGNAESIDDVMAHVHTFGVMAPEAAGIIQ